MHRLWLTVGDGLQAQRVHLCLAEWREVLSAGAPLPDVTGLGLVSALATNPVGDVATTRVDAAGLRAWVDLPARYAFPVGPANVLAPSAAAQVRSLIGDAVGDELAADLTAVCGAAAWWVGFFAVVRHRGVHHLSLQPDKPPVTRTVLEEACGVVALGVAIRMLEEHLRADGVDAEGLRRAYCRALAASVAVERRMPALLDELGELRLVDLVSMAVPWRGRFTKYAGGTGAGQVE